VELRVLRGFVVNGELLRHDLGTDDGSRPLIDPTGEDVAITLSQSRLQICRGDWRSIRTESRSMLRC
jgi:hypothetical protein